MANVAPVIVVSPESLSFDGAMPLAQEVSVRAEGAPALLLSADASHEALEITDILSVSSKLKFTFRPELWMHGPGRIDVTLVFQCGDQRRVVALNVYVQDSVDLGVRG